MDKPHTSPVSVLPPSPTAAAMASFVEHPVSLHTGTPEVSIPLHEIRTGDISLPIGLSYHSGGIKVEERSSSVGLGWSLNAGGAIIVASRGLPDDGSVAHWAKVDSFRRGLMTPARSQQYLYSILIGGSDSEPDTYIVSAGGLSCRIFPGLGGTWHALPRDKAVRVQRNVDGFAWVITDMRGIRYRFNHVEQTATTNYSQSQGPGGVTESGYYSGPTAWYVAEIEDARTNKVVFSYTNTNTSYLSRSSEQVSVLASGLAGACTDIIRDYSWRQVQTSGKSLQSITYDGGQVHFITSDARLDMPGDRRLQRVEVRPPGGGTALRTFYFHQGYFASNNMGTPSFNAVPNTQDAYRLRLDSIQEIGIGAPGAYKFEYHFSLGLPRHSSVSQDHWGYFNGKANTSLVRYVQNGMAQGANRDPDWTRARECSLFRITYPTGGVWEAEYESNAYHGVPASNPVLLNLASLSGDNGNGNLTNVFEQSFFVPPGVGLGTVPVNTSLTVMGVDVNCGCTAYVVIVRPDNTQIPVFNGQGLVHLNPGTYTLRGTITTEFNGNPYVYFHASLTANVPGPATTPGPGIRIRRSVLRDGGVDQLIREYEYLTPGSQSSGELGSTPQYVSTFTRKVEYQPCVYNVYSATSNYTLANTKGSYVGYSYVTVRESGTGNGGMTRYRFTNFKHYNDLNAESGFPYPPNSPMDWQRGQLLEEMAYRREGTLNTPASRRGIGYQQVNYSIGAYGIKIARHTSDGLNPTPEGSVSNSSYAIYNINSGAMLPVADTLVAYDLPAVAKVTSRTYSPVHYQEVLSTLAKSNGHKEASYTTYPQDYADTTGFIDSMKISHHLAYPIEQVRYKEEGSARHVLSGILTKYRNTSKGLVDEVFELETKGPIPMASFKFSNRASGTPTPMGDNTVLGEDTRYRSRIKYTEYGSKGNVAEYNRAGGHHTVYLWGYNNQYPVAKVENATYAAVTATGVNLAVLNNVSSTDAQKTAELNKIRNHATMAKSMVTTMLYRPVFGVSSQTDPSGRTTTYHYDAFGRLQLVKDYQGNIIEDYRYHYRTN